VRITTSKDNKTHKKEREIGKKNFNKNRVFRIFITATEILRIKY
jgi:hypothetical protein